MGNDKNTMLEPPDTSWFDSESEKYLSRDDFREFQEVSGVELRDLVSEDEAVVRKAQEEIVAQTRVLNEIRNQHGGYGMPLLYYTHDLKLGKKIPKQNAELEKINLASDMGDSLRRRHIALSYSILPDEINKVSEYFEKPIIIKNIGSGVGLDVINSVMMKRERVKIAWNCDISKDALNLGRKITQYLTKNGKINPGVIRYTSENMIVGNKKAGLILMIGIICGLTNMAAYLLLKKAYKNLEWGGKLIVSSSNHHMKCTDPLASFLIQHIGTIDNPLTGWGLNFRTKEVMRGLLSKAGFRDISICDDANYPGRDTISDEILFGVDPLPSEVMGYDLSRKPLILPNKEILDKRIGYNWIAVATK